MISQPMKNMFYVTENDTIIHIKMWICLHVYFMYAYVWILILPTSLVVGQSFCLFYLLLIGLLFSDFMWPLDFIHMVYLLTWSSNTVIVYLKQRICYDICKRNLHQC